MFATVKTLEKNNGTENLIRTTSGARLGTTVEHDGLYGQPNVQSQQRRAPSASVPLDLRV